MKGEQHTMIDVFAFPPRESCSTRVRVLFLKGMCISALFLAFSASADTTFEQQLVWRKCPEYGVFSQPTQLKKCMVL